MKKIKTKGIDGLNSLTGLVPAFYNLAVMGIAMSIALTTIKNCFMSEERIHITELILMNTSLIKISDKDKIKTIYIPISEVDDYVESFLKKNKKYKLDTIQIGKLYKKDKEEIFYYQLTRQYKSKPYKYKEPEACPECGRYYDDEYS